jgi:DNA-binding MarR family transcriptional regulator
MVAELSARLEAAGFPGITPSFHPVFENLDNAGTRLTELAARAGMTHQSMGELVARLEALGYVTRAADPTDRRARLVCLTQQGQALVREAIREISAIWEEWAERLAAAGLHGDLVMALGAALDGAASMAGVAGEARALSGR